MREAHAIQRAPMLPFSDGQDALRVRLRHAEHERDRLLEEVLHLQRVAQTGLMTSGLAHDLANQITAVMGNAELALMKNHPEALRDGLHTVLEHSGRIHDTVDAFVSFVRRREHRVRVFPVSEALESVQRLVEPVARGEGVACLAACTTDAQIRADRQLVEQALVNLALNAIRAAAKVGGRVVISAADGPDVTADLHDIASHRETVRLAVRDTGSGIAEDVRRRLFEPFATGSASEGGTGLGLYVVRQVVERYRGRILVETSETGTRIDMELPAVVA